MSDVVLDTCCLINLCAVGDLRTWLSQTGLTWHLPRAVADEALFLPTVGEDGTVHKTPVDLDVYQEGGLLVPCDVASRSETDLFVRLAVDLDDGEAMALAIASTRGWSLATDDRRAMEIARRRRVDIQTTAEIIRNWSTDAGLTRAEIAAALRRIEQLARFLPARDYPLYGWWREIVDSQPG